MECSENLYKNDPLKVYIAGPITGNKMYEMNFKQAELLIKQMGHTPLNPVKNVGFSYKEYIDMGLCELMRCDVLYALPGWEKSDGASLEVSYAKAVGLKIYHNISELWEAGPWQE